MLDLIMTAQFRKDLKRINKRGKDLSLLEFCGFARERGRRSPVGFDREIYPTPPSRFLLVIMIIL